MTYTWEQLAKIERKRVKKVRRSRFYDPYNYFKDCHNDGYPQSQFFDYEDSIEDLYKDLAGF